MEIGPTTKEAPAVQKQQITDISFRLHPNRSIQADGGAVEQRVFHDLPHLSLIHI